MTERAGLLLDQVDQSPTQEEPIETNSAYVEYLSLIDQSIEPEVIEDDANDAQIVEDPLSETVQTADAPWYLKLLQFLANYIGKILSIFFAH